MLFADQRAGSRAAPFARTHDRSPFRARCRRRDAARAGGDCSSRAHKSPDHFFPTLDRIHRPPGETKVIARRFHPIEDHFQLSSR
jgi:hypothetical protein